MTEDLQAKVERHERLLYGIDDGGVGLKARVVEVERVIAEWKAERQEAKDDRRKLMMALIIAIALQAITFVLDVFQHP